MAVVFKNSGLVFGILLAVLFLRAAQTKAQSISGQDDIVYTEKDAAMFADIISKYKNEADKPIGTLIPEIGRYFLGNEYVAHTLEEGDEEKLIINLAEVDCTTYAEYLFALARTLKSENQTFEQFARELKSIRYRNGIINEYPSRLHYFSEWIYNNKENGLVTTPADDIGKAFPNKLNFMSTHPESYKHLEKNPAYIGVLRRQEREINNNHYFYIPKAEIAQKEHLLREGDIIGLTTSIEGLDISHVGVLVKGEKGLHLLNASQSSMKVEISEEPISAYLKPASKNTGIMVARPVE